MRNTLDFTIAHTVVTSLIHSKLDYYMQLSVFQPSPVISRSPPTHSKFYSLRCVRDCNIFARHSRSQISSHWLRIEQRLRYQVISTIYKTLQSNKLNYLNDLFPIQRNTDTRSSDTVTLQHPSGCSRLKLTDLSRIMILYSGIVSSSSFVNQRLTIPAPIKLAHPRSICVSVSRAT